MRRDSRKTKTEKRGPGFIDTISAQLQQEMHGLRGFGARNMRNMRQFFENWAENLIWQDSQIAILDCLK